MIVGSTLDFSFKEKNPGEPIVIIYEMDIIFISFK